MHIPDGYLGPPTYLAAYAACAPLWAVAARRLRERLSARRAPLLAISAAFSFLVMMFNVPLPGGTTGHAVGGVLIAIAIGPLGALFSITIALVIQALLFGDGGITAIGANCINMAFILPFTGYAVAGAPRRRAPLGCQTADDPSTQSNEALANNPPRRGTVMCMRSREVRGCRSQSDPGAPRGRQAPGMLRGSLGETGSIGWGLGLPAFGLVLALCLPLASGAQERVSRAQDQAVPEAEFDLADVLITRTPLPGSSVELRYRYERDREQQDAGSAVTHVHQPSAILSLAATDWLGLSATIPYQVRDLRTPDGTSSETRNLGDLSTEVLATFLKDPVQQLAVAGGFDLGVPTGSIKDGTGGQWTLTPFLGAGKLVGPVQLMADGSYQDDFRAAPDAGQIKRELLYNLAVGPLLFDGQLFPFLELDGTYAFTGTPTIRHRGQLYLSPGIRISSGGWLAALVEPRGSSDGEKSQSSKEKPWWQRLSLAIGAQFPLTQAREFEWGLTTSLKLDL